MKRIAKESIERWMLVLRVGIFLFCLMQVIGWLYFWTLSGYFSFGQRVAGLLVDGFGVVLLIMSLGQMFRLLPMVGGERLFTRHALCHVRHAVYYFICWTAYAPVQRALSGLVETIRNPVGDRHLFFSIDAGDHVRLLILAGFMLFAFAVQQGVTLREDQLLTV